MNVRRYCPACAKPLTSQMLGGHTRLVCPDSNCGYVFWDNPTPVVAGVVEHRGALIFARNVAWPREMYGLITGFLEPREDPATGIVREVAEELGLAARVTEFIGAYGFARKNQLLLAYHLVAEGEIQLNDELDAYWHVAKEHAEYWPGGTGLAVRDWLLGQGYAPRPRTLPPAVRAWMQAPPASD